MFFFIWIPLFFIFKYKTKQHNSNTLKYGWKISFWTQCINATFRIRYITQRHICLHLALVTKSSESTLRDKFCKSYLQQNTEIALSILSYTPADWVLVRWSQEFESSQILMPTRSALKCQLGMWIHKTRRVRVTFQQAAGRLWSTEFTVAFVFLLNKITESIDRCAALTSGAVQFNWVFGVYRDLRSCCNSAVIYTSQTANNQAWL